MARPFDVQGNDAVITASIGITMAPDDGEDVDSLIRNADAAMNAAKNQGRGTYQFYKLSMNEVAHRNLRLESDLRKALDRGELLLHYQIVLTARTSLDRFRTRSQESDRASAAPDRCQRTP